jgi:hypothetical protein
METMLLRGFLSAPTRRPAESWKRAGLARNPWHRLLFRAVSPPVAAHPATTATPNCF